MRIPFRQRSIHIQLFVVYLALLALPLIGLYWLKGPLMVFFGEAWWLLPSSVAMVIALVAPFSYVSLQRRIQERILERQRQYQQTFLQAAQGMTLIKEMRRLLNLIVHILTRTVGVEQASLWLLEKKSGRFILQVARGPVKLEAADSIGRNEPLIQCLIHQKGPVIRQELKGTVLAPAVKEMDRIGTAILIPSFVGEKLLGFVALGLKKSRQPYTDWDLEIFEVMANQAALAIENAQFYEDLKRTQAELFQTAKLASLGQMAGGMGHQINNRFHVLTILAGTLKAALQQSDLKQLTPEMLAAFVEQTKETLTKIEDNALRGGDIVKSLLRFSKPGAVEAKPITVQEIVATARDVIQYKIDTGAIDFVQEIPPTLPPVQGNLNQLADSLFNLISNAYDAIQKKGELIQANQLPNGPRDPSPFKGQIHLRTRKEQKNGKSWVVLEFQDNGIGMTPQELDNLFVPFFTTKATSQKGTGLGLYVILRIIERHGGSISTNSTYGVGTTFTIRLPAADGS